MVGESAGSILFWRGVSLAHPQASAADTPAATVPRRDDSFAACNQTVPQTLASLVTIVPNSWPISTVSPILVFHSLITPANDD